MLKDFFTSRKPPSQGQNTRTAASDAFPVIETARSFDLNIEKILEGWETRHAIRELVANALDEQILTKTRDVEIGQRQEKWYIRDFGRGLRCEHFTQNENQEKLANSDKAIGKFGVGLKDALATLNRHGVGVSIQSKHGNVTLDQKSKHDFSDVVTLHAIIAPPNDRVFVGTEIVLDGVTTKDMDDAKSFFLKFSDERELERTRLGSILRKDKGRNGRIYVTGLLVAEEENFAFSYNITSLTKRMRDALNRERTNVGRTAYTDRVKEMLLEARSSPVADTLAEELGKIESGACSDEVKWVDVAKHAARILNAGQRVIFVAPSEIVYHGDALEHAKSDGIRIITVPDNIKASISGLRDLAGNAVRDIYVYQDERQQSFKFTFLDYRDLSSNERVVFDTWRNLVSLAGGLPRAVKEIKVTETMRPDFSGRDHTAGLWDPTTGNIIVRRDLLRSADLFAGTLLHEVVHAKSGFGDVTRDFEIELTSMLGRIAAAKIK